MIEKPTRPIRSGGREARRALRTAPRSSMLPALERNLPYCEPMDPDEVARIDKRIAPELGGKNPQVGMPDLSDLKTVASNVLASAFWNMGENCSAGSRLVVHRSIKDALPARGGGERRHHDPESLRHGHLRHLPRESPRGADGDGPQRRHHRRGNRRRLRAELLHQGEFRRQRGILNGAGACRA